MDYPPHGRTDIARRFEWDECVLGGGGGYATSSRRDWSSHALLLLLLWLRENMNEIASFIELIQNLVYNFFHPSCVPSVVVVASIVRCTTSSTTMAAQRYTTYTEAARPELMSLTNGHHRPF